MYIYTYIHAHIFADIHTYMCITYIHTCIHTYVYIYICITYIYIYIYTCIYIYMYMYMYLYRYISFFIAGSLLWPGPQLSSFELLATGALVPKQSFSLAVKLAASDAFPIDPGVQGSVPGIWMDTWGVGFWMM